MGRISSIRITRLLLKNYKELHHISENKGIEFSLFMKQTLTQIKDSYPAKLREDVICEEQVKPETNINGVSQQTQRELLNICAHIGCDLSNLLKIELKKISESYPERMKSKPLAY